MKTTGNKNLRILVVDSNKCYAGLVKESIEEHLAEGVSVDVATNIWELRRRLSNDYVAVIADISVSDDSAEIRAELEAADAPVYYWSAANQKAHANISLEGMPSSKPSNLRDLRSTINKFVTRR